MVDCIAHKIKPYTAYIHVRNIRLIFRSGVLDDRVGPPKLMPNAVFLLLFLTYFDEKRDTLGIDLFFHQNNVCVDLFF